MFPSEDPEMDCDMHFLFYAKEYQNIQNQFNEKKRRERLKKEIFQNRDQYSYRYLYDEPEKPPLSETLKLTLRSVFPGLFKKI